MRPAPITPTDMSAICIFLSVEHSILDIDRADLKSLSETSFWIGCRDELLPDIALIPGCRNRPYDWFVLQFLCLVKFMTTGIARGVIVAQIGMILVDGSYDITLHNLHVVDIVEQLHCW